MTLYWEAQPSMLKDYALTHCTKYETRYAHSLSNVYLYYVEIWFGEQHPFLEWMSEDYKCTTCFLKTRHLRLASKRTDSPHRTWAKSAALIPICPGNAIVHACSCSYNSAYVYTSICKLSEVHEHLKLVKDD